MQNAVCSDGRARGCFSFTGPIEPDAGQAGSFRCKIYPKTIWRTWPKARSLVRSGNFDALEMLYEDVPDTLSQLIRTAFVPRIGAKFIVSDFSAIEARVIAWLAG